MFTLDSDSLFSISTLSLLAEKSCPSRIVYGYWLRFNLDSYVYHRTFGIKVKPNQSCCHVLMHSSHQMA